MSGSGLSHLQLGADRAALGWVLLKEGAMSGIGLGAGTVGGAGLAPALAERGTGTWVIVRVS